MCFKDAAAIALLMIVVSGLYGVRLTAMPIVGEASRYGTAAPEMLATGDWGVPRQQGRVFPEKPPLTIWAMAIVGQIRGAVDAVAVRLPSVVAIVLTAIVIFIYTRGLVSRLAGMMASLAYATMAQGGFDVPRATVPYHTETHRRARPCGAAAAPHGHRCDRAAAGNGRRQEHQNNRAKVIGLYETNNAMELERAEAYETAGPPKDGRTLGS